MSKQDFSEQQAPRVELVAGEKVGEFTNPRPSLGMQRAAGVLLGFMRAEGFHSATLSSFHRYGDLLLQTEMQVAGSEFCEQTKASITVDADVPTVREVCVIGNAYRGADPSQERCPECAADVCTRDEHCKSDDHEQDCPVHLFP